MHGDNNNSESKPFKSVPDNKALEPVDYPEETEKNIWSRLGVTKQEFLALLELRADLEKRNKIIVFLIGVIFTPVSLAGALLGYVRGYNRILRPKDILPQFYPMRPIIRLAMIMGVILIWLIQVLALFFIVPFAGNNPGYAVLTIAILALINLVGSYIVWLVFRRWRIGANNELIEGRKFGTARFAREDELEKYKTDKGIFIGEGFKYSKQGHLLTVAGSRSGKFTNLLAPNLLGKGDVDGSWVIIDPKGEICAVTHAFQDRTALQNVVVLNPWGLLDGILPSSSKYNPLDILDVTSPHLVDDCHMLAEMLVPLENGKNKFFSDSARSIISGFILYIAIAEKSTSRSLKTLWRWVRYPQSMWDRLIAEMENSIDEMHGDNLMFAASEIQKYMLSGSNTWGSILSTVMQATDFLKSPSLQTAMESGFDPYKLAKKDTTIYVIIPTDKLQSHSRWLRLVTTSTMRAVIRRPNKRVVFMLDEFSALGYLPEIEIALSTYAGYNVTVWAILQSLVQLQHLYQNNWEVFIGNTAVRHFFGIHNNFDAEYISKAIGRASNVINTRSWFGVNTSQSNERFLITQDELRIESGSHIFTFIDDVPPTIFNKQPYYEVPELKQRAGRNPYI